MAKKYFRVFSEGGWTKADLENRFASNLWLAFQGKDSFFTVTELSTDKEELMEKAREERERIRWSQSYSRNPRKMIHKVFVHEVDHIGKYLLTKKEKDTAIAWAKARAMEDANFAMENAEVLALL